MDFLQGFCIGVYGVYAALLLVGGVMGYSRAKSVPSLVAGIVSGVIMGVAAGVLSAQPRTGLGIGVAVSVVLSFISAARYRKTRVAMPSVLIMALSIVVLLTSMFALFLLPHA